MKGKIVIKENKVYFEPNGLKKPNKFDFYFFSYGLQEATFDRAMKEYEASKQLIEVSNWIKIDTKNEKCQLLMTKMRIASEFIPNGKPCEVEVTDKAVITKIN